MKSRIMYIDRLKGIGILCVVIGHLIAVFTEEAPLLSTLYSFIYLFHMPLFSFLSGLTGKCNLKKILLVSLPSSDTEAAGTLGRLALETLEPVLGCWRVWDVYFEAFVLYWG